MTYDEISEFVAKHNFPDFVRIMVYAEVKYAFTADGLPEETIRDVAERIFDEYQHSSDYFDFIEFTWKVKDAYDKAEEKDWDEIIEEALED